jgi:hypothetical protein
MHAINNYEYNHTMYYNLNSSPIPSYSSNPMNFNSNFNTLNTYSSPIVPSYYYKPTMPYDYSSSNNLSHVEYNDSTLSSYSYFPSNCFYTPSSSSNSSAPLSTNSTSNSNDLNSYYQNAILSVSKK